MAGEMRWFRWRHGTVNDPRMGLIARKAGVRLPDVLVVWAAIMEEASQSEERGTFTLDCEAYDCLFGFDDGWTERIVDMMEARGMVQKGTVTDWHRHQVKREREEPASSTGRVRQHRANRRGEGGVPEDNTGDGPLFPQLPFGDETAMETLPDTRGVSTGEQPRNAMKRHETPRNAQRRGEEKREENNTHTPTQSPARGDVRESMLTPAENACRAMQVAGVTDASPGDQKLLALLQRGVDALTFGDAAARAHRKGKGAGYAFGIVANELEALTSSLGTGSSGPPPLQPSAWDGSRSSIEAMAGQLGLPPWDSKAFDVGQGESFAHYTGRIRRIVDGQRTAA